MPTLSKACRNRYCRNRATSADGWCDECREKYAPKNDARESPSERGYDRAWRRLRELKLSASPLCERCKAKGLVVPANVVHHRDHDQHNNAWRNLESLCRVCHEAEHGRDRRHRCHK